MAEEDARRARMHAEDSGMERSAHVAAANQALAKTQEELRATVAEYAKRIQVEQQLR